MEAACTQQSVYVSCGCGVAVKFSFLNFVLHSRTRRGFEIRSRDKRGSLAAIRVLTKKWMTR